ncbi:MAG: MerR family transcriptional regulator, partial [Gemmatimonadota bacterium]
RLDDGAHCTAARGLAEGKLVDVRAKLGDLQRIEQALSQLVRRCRVGRGTVSCPLIDALHTP